MTRAAGYGIFALTLASAIAHGQAPEYYTGRPHSGPHQTLTAQQMTTETIRRLIGSSIPLTTNRIPLLHRMGDAAALRVIEILKDHGPLTATEQRNVLDMVHMAFELPDAIMHATDRSPVSSLLLLRRIDDPALQERVAGTRQFITAASAAR